MVRSKYFPKFLPGVKINQYLPESLGDFAFAAGQFSNIFSGTGFLHGFYSCRPPLL
jgi:hypothetical protein